MLRAILAVAAFLTSIAAAPQADLTVTVTAPGTTSFAPHAEQCVNAYTAAHGNPGCNALFDANDNPVNGGPVASSSSSSWIAKQGSGTVDFTDLNCPAATNPGGAYYGLDPCQSMFYNANGASSIATTNMTYYNLTCNNAAYSCGHSWSGAKIYVPSGARAQNPNSDHHFSGQGNPCDPNGKSSPVNPPSYTIAAGDRCEMDDWLAQPGYPTVVPSSNTAGTALTVEGEGQCDMDAVLGGYNASGSTASNQCEGLNMNPADLVTAVQTSSYMPYALLTATVCTESNYIYPSTYFDGYETQNGCPPNGARFWSDITDAQVNATSWPPAKKAIWKTLHHYGGIIFDTTGGYGSGFSVQILGSSGFTVGNGSSDTDANDPIKWLYDTANGGSGLQSISNADGGSEQGLDVSLSLAGSSYSVANDVHFCTVTAGLNAVYSPGNTLPKTCGNV
jgi:hypothetical protein